MTSTIKSCATYVMNGLSVMSASMSKTSRKFYSFDGAEAISKLGILLPENRNLYGINTISMHRICHHVKNFLYGTKIITTASSYIAEDATTPGKLYVQLPHNRNGAINYTLMLYTPAHIHDAVYFLRKYCRVDCSKIITPIQSCWSYCLNNLGVYKVYQPVVDLVKETPYISSVIKHNPCDFKEACIVLASLLSAYGTLSQFSAKYNASRHVLPQAVGVDAVEQSVNTSVPTNINGWDVIDFLSGMMKSLGKVVLITCKHFRKTDAYFYTAVVTNLATIVSLALKPDLRP